MNKWATKCKQCGTKSDLTFKQKVISGMLGTLIVFAVIGLASGPDPDTGSPQPTSKPNDVAAVPSSADKEKAAKALKDYMELGIKTGIIKSYEFSDRRNLVYVTKLWYVMDVAQKKTFLTAVKNTKSVSTGEHFFEVRDGYSDEKVAEVTAFLGSLEIYK